VFGPRCEELRWAPDTEDGGRSLRWILECARTPRVIQRLLVNENVDESLSIVYYSKTDRDRGRSVDGLSKGFRGCSILKCGQDGLTIYRQPYPPSTTRRLIRLPSKWEHLLYGEHFGLLICVPYTITAGPSPEERTLQVLACLSLLLQALPLGSSRTIGAVIELNHRLEAATTRARVDSNHRYKKTYIVFAFCACFTTRRLASCASAT
jgi:hypothetical protein